MIYDDQIPCSYLMIYVATIHGAYYGIIGFSKFCHLFFTFFRFNLIGHSLKKFCCRFHEVVHFLLEI